MFAEAAAAFRVTAREHTACPYFDMLAEVTIFVVVRRTGRRGQVLCACMLIIRTNLEVSRPFSACCRGRTSSRCRLVRPAHLVRTSACSNSGKKYITRKLRGAILQSEWLAEWNISSRRLAFWSCTVTMSTAMQNAPRIAAGREAEPGGIAVPLAFPTMLKRSLTRDTARKQICARSASEACSFSF